MSETLPKRIGGWRIDAEIGRGTMGVVYKGRGAKGRLAAIKVVRIVFPVSRAQRLLFEKRFLGEGRIVARLTHPGIVGVYDVGRDKRTRVPFMALEFLEGQTLADLLAEGRRLPWRESLTYVAQVAEALHYAHEQGVVHRDIKPANIMVLPGGQAKIMDFGLAKHETGIELTSTGQFMGTPLYMSPEQALSERVDTRADLFSLGTVAYTLLTGKRAFEADSIPQVMNKVVHQNPPPPTKLGRDLPPEADYLLARAMAKMRRDRYPSGRMFAEDIADVLGGRPPRHRGGWTPPDLAEGTLVSTRDRGKDGEAFDDFALEPLPQGDESGPRLKSLLALGVALALLTALLAWLPFWRERLVAVLEPEESRVEGESAEAPSPSPSQRDVPSLTEATTSPEEGQQSPVPAGEQAASPVPEGPANEDDVVVDDSGKEEAPSPLPSSSPEVGGTPSPIKAQEAESPRPRPSPQRRLSKAPAAASLSVSFEHSLESGTLRVLVDDRLVLQQRLTSRVTKDLLLFKLRSGLARNTMQVAPGQRRIRVEVLTPDEIRRKDTSASFRSGLERHLEVKVGRLRDNLTLSWR